MIIPLDAIRKYEAIRGSLEIVGDRAKDIVRTYCDDKGFAFASRYKTLGSLSEKIETGRFSKWSDLNDLFACTIVIPTLQYEAEALGYLGSQFEPIEIKVRGTAQKDPSTFHFDSTRFTGRFAQFEENVSDNIANVLFEVQIRSAFEHAWVVTTHALTYKGDEIDWRKIRLAAQLKASVEQLDNLILGFEESAQYISQQNWPEIQAKQAIESFFREQFDLRLIPSECRPTNWTRFCDNVFSIISSSSSAYLEEPADTTTVAMDALREEIQQLGFGKFPRSVSLLQFVLGALTKAEIVSAPLQQYIPLVTYQLCDIYPHVEQFSESFNFELPTES